ncbi:MULTISPECIES: aa3-type cytochrome oxidase subunit CtaJ [Crossiella]|uniref:Uncharacterized protein n=1 Tax=Crossiella cryophila TaxID=43355 RepID=A0A7W7FUX0_9PSEU|nr:MULTISPECIES: hypothetical protein [Crossiella]MBB4676254.1 hypothetical protein [Crossiella cryophila]MCK2241201.1 hypothetical protein [Crossiella sp. S99.2]MCK2253655.1 hypothetical protein [Crossiella sp. S99.1]
MTVLETILVFAGIPLALYLGITLLTMWPDSSRGQRYRPGQEWPHEPVWWSANPAGLTTSAAPAAHDNEAAAAAGTARGGARGNW